MSSVLTLSRQHKLQVCPCVWPFPVLLHRSGVCPLPGSASQAATSPSSAGAEAPGELRVGLDRGARSLPREPGPAWPVTEEKAGVPRTPCPVKDSYPRTGDGLSHSLPIKPVFVHRQVLSRIWYASFQFIFKYFSTYIVSKYIYIYNAPGCCSSVD